MTKQEKIKALLKANPKLSFNEACLLLGIKPDDPELNNFMDFFNNILNGMKK